MPPAQQRRGTVGRVRLPVPEQVVQLVLGSLQPVAGAERGEQRPGAVERAARLIGVARHPAQVEQRPSLLENLTALGEQRHRPPPGLAGLVGAAARRCNRSRRSEADGVLQAIVGQGCQALGVAAGGVRRLELAEGDEQLGPPPLELHDQIALRRQPVGDRERAVVALERRIRPPAVGVELAQELERQHLLALRGLRAGALERLEQQGLGVGESPLEPRDVAEPDPHRGEPQLIAHLQVDLARLRVAFARQIPAAALLVHDPEVHERVRALGEAPVPAADLERRLEVGDGRVPFAQVLVDQPQVVAHVGGADLVADAAVERERLLVVLARSRRIAVAVGDAPQDVERLGHGAQVGAAVGKLEPALGAVAALGEPRHPEQRFGALQVEAGAGRDGLDLILGAQHFPAVRECRLAVPLREAARDGLAFEDGPLTRRQRSRLGE